MIKLSVRWGASLVKGGKKAFFGSDKLIISEGLNIMPVAGRGIQCACFFLS